MNESNELKPKRKKLLFIMNPRAGTMLASKYLTEILMEFEKGGYITTVLLTAKSGDGRLFTMEYGRGMDVIACAGGDGTLNEVIDGVLSAGIECNIGYIPSGSTNDFATSVNIPKNIVEAAANIKEGAPYPLDIGTFNGRYFSYVASFGAFTSISYKVPQTLKNILGHTAYILQGATDVLNIKPIHTKVYVDEATEDEIILEDDYIFGAICNSKSVAGIVTIKSEDVDMNDGKMELILVRSPKNIIELHQVTKAILEGTMKSDCINFMSAKRIRVEIEEGIHWTLDGEFEEGRTINEINTIKGGINMILPKNSNISKENEWGRI